MLFRKIVALADGKRQYAILAGLLDQRGIACRRELRALVLRGAPDHVAVAAANHDVGKSGRQRGALRHRHQMILALGARDLDQLRFVDDGRAAQQRTRDRDLVLARELSDQGARRIGELRQPFGEVGAGQDFGIRHQADQDAVKEIDVFGAEMRSALQEQIRDAPRRIGTAFRIVTSNDLVEPGDHQCRSGHPITQKPADTRGFGQSRQGS